MSGLIEVLSYILEFYTTKSVACKMEILETNDFYH